MKLFFFDIESTGTRHWKNGIHQISGCIEINGEIKETFDFKVKPYKDAIIEDEALAVSGITKKDLEAYPEMKDVHKKLVLMLAKYVNQYDKTDKFHLVGYNNSSFDNQFLRAFFVQCDDKYFGSWFWSSSIDVMVLAAQHLLGKRHEMIDFKLKIVAAYVGIPIDEAKLHDAVYDVGIVRRLYDFITSKTAVIV